jgi:hypothetical protein
MILLDANVSIYAVDADAPQRRSTRRPAAGSRELCRATSWSVCRGV